VKQRARALALSKSGTQRLRLGTRLMAKAYKATIHKRHGYWLVKITHKKTGVVVKPYPVTSLRKAIVEAIIAPYFYTPKNWY
jgi:hypothetical protein